MYRLCGKHTCTHTHIPHRKVRNVIATYLTFNWQTYGRGIVESEPSILINIRTEKHINFESSEEEVCVFTRNPAKINLTMIHVIDISDPAFPTLRKREMTISKAFVFSATIE